MFGVNLGQDKFSHGSWLEATYWGLALCSKCLWNGKGLKGRPEKLRPIVHFSTSSGLPWCQSKELVSSGQLLPKKFIKLSTHHLIKIFFFDACSVMPMAHLIRVNDYQPCNFDICTIANFKADLLSSHKGIHPIFNQWQNVCKFWEKRNKSFP